MGSSLSLETISVTNLDVKIASAVSFSRIGDVLLLDPTEEEEAQADSTGTIVMDEQLNIIHTDIVAHDGTIDLAAVLAQCRACVLQSISTIRKTTLYS